MGDIIWLMYLAGVVSSFGTVLGVATMVALGFAGIARLATAVNDEPCPASVKPALIIAASCAVIASIIPSKTTIYAAAAVAAGDKALATPTGDKAVRALNAWLDKQIADDSKDAGK